MVDLAANALTDLATVKEELGITVSTYDNSLKRAINAASGFVESYVGRKLYWEEGIEEARPGYGTRFMMVDRRPLSAITSITYDGSTVDSGNYEIHTPGAGLILAVGNWEWTTVAVGGLQPEDPYPGAERKLYTVTYDGGWVTPQQVIDDPTLTRDLPWDLEDAVIRMASDRYLAKGRDSTVKSEKLMSWSATYSEESMSMQVRTVLDSYRGAC